MLCRMKGINSYPSLYVFKTGMVSKQIVTIVGHSFAHVLESHRQPLEVQWCLAG